MPLEEKLTFQRIATLVITTLGFIAALISIYVFFFQDKKVDLQYEIVTNTNVLDINADVGRLDITYNGISLKENKQNLRIINLRLINRGTENILKEFFDDNDLLGFEVSQGKIIEKPEVIETSSKYLKENLKVEIDSNERVKLSKVIIEPKEFIVLKLLILHKSGILPKIVATGKIAGIKEITVLNTLETKDEKPFFEQVFNGPFFVQIVRVITYFLMVVILIFIIAISTDKISNAKQKHKRKKLVAEFKNKKTYSFSKMDDAIFDRYINTGDRKLRYIRALLADEKLLTTKYNRSIARIKRKEETKAEDIEILNESDFRLHYSRDNEWYTFNTMLEDGLIIKEKDRIIVNQPMKSSLDNFIDFLSEKSVNKDSSH